MDHLLPEWAQPFGTPDAANDYWDLVCEIAETRWGDDASLNYLAGRIEHADGRVAQLHNIARAAVGLDVETQRHGLYHFLSILDDMKRDSEDMRRWEWAAPRLRRRLQSNWEPEWDLLREPIDAFTQWAVAIDTATGCAPVAAEWLDDWGVEAEEVWERATAQSLRPAGMRRTAVDQVQGLTHPRFHKKLFCFEGDMYTSGMAEDLTGRFQKALGDLGALITAPTAHQLYVYPIRDLEAVPDIAGRLVVLSVFRQFTEPNHVSTSVLWYRGPGQLEPCISVQFPDNVQVTCNSEPLRGVLLGTESAA